ncbi:MAG: SafA/ExsA family spore coat assembly protein [Bacilli bacterium]|nr:SafA/ExsA family spore coat assembly protein [Bacilli bacterium]MDD4809471.1 SafA/ExsA family spore coat assembly protein [Bacilli bacterium]
METYTVIPGDTIWRIAHNYGIHLDELLAVNPQINNPNFIIPGQILNIPNHNSTYNIMSGDTMWNIANNYGIDLKKLLMANPQINNPNFIIPGQTINIPSDTSNGTVPIEETTPNNLRSFETEVIRLVNQERQKNGVPPLTENTELSRIARLKSNDFVNNNYFSHNSPTYGSPFEMLRTFGVNFSAAAENIASGQRTAEEVMNTWMNSSGHRANILNQAYNQIGVGVARDSDGTLYWTQLFIRS